jgi:hypothetical protein
VKEREMADSMVITWNVNNIVELCVCVLLMANSMVIIGTNGIVELSNNV